MMKPLRSEIQGALEDVLAGKELDIRTVMGLIRAAGGDCFDFLSAASRIRDHFRGRVVDLCSIVNAKSGACSEDCAFCAQSSHHATNAPVYPLISLEDIERAASGARNNGARRFCIVTSGWGIDSHEDLERIARGVERVRALGLSPCATLGTLTREQLAYLRDAGLHRYHHNIETSREYFPRVCRSHTFAERLEVLQDAQSVGLSTCSGGILGMGESMEDRISMAFSLRDINIDSVPINFLMPIPGTPLHDSAPITPFEALRSIAFFRFVLPKKEIRICAGRGATLRQLHPMIFQAGADGFMIGNYLTTTGLDPAEDLRMIQDMEMQIKI